MKMPINAMRPLWRVSLLTVLALATVTALCGWTSSCGTPTHKAAVAADSIANSLKTAADLNHSLYASGQITLDERQQMATLIDQSTQANDVLVAQLSQAVANGGTVTASSVVQSFNTFLTQLNALEANGVLHLKSADAQAKFEVVIGAIKLQVQVLQAIINVTGSSNRSPVGGSYLAFAALALTPEELETLISLALAAFGAGVPLVQKLSAMKSETDVQLLADAATQDLAARTEAKADEAAE